MSPSSEPPRLGIVGGGRAAWAFGAAWRQCGWPIAGLTLRDGSHSDVPQLLGAEVRPIADLAGASDVVLLAVPDGAIAGASGMLPTVKGSPIVFHASGALTSDILQPHERRFSLHPLLALPTVGSPVPLEGALFVYEGSEDESGFAERLATTCGARLLRISKESKTLYHAAAVFASNYVATLLEISRALMKRSGLPSDIEPYLGNLARSAIANWETQQGPARFTGPVARGDLAVIRQHLAALENQRDLAAIYEALARETAGRIKNGE